MADPVPGVKYRIRNEDRLMYLEALNHTESTTEIILRPEKLNDRQYWQFEKAAGTTGYYVRNIANSNQCLYLGSSNAVSITSVISSNTLVNVWHKNGSYRLSFFYNNADHYLHAARDTGKIHAVATSQDHDIFTWQLVPVHNGLLQPGNYRIRNINGKSLLTMPEGQHTNVYLRSQRDPSLYQRWTVTWDHLAGHYTIRSAANNLYLGCNGKIAYR